MSRISRCSQSLCVTTLGFVAACSFTPGPRIGEDVGSGSSEVTEKCGASTGGPVQGVDVSRYQGNFDFASAHVSFAYASIGDGSYLDPDFATNWAKMQAAGVLRGAYQFFEPGDDEVSQANEMVAKVGKLGAGDLPAMIDLEVTGGQSGATIAARVRHWLEIVEAGTGKRPIIYTGSYFWQDNVGDASFGAYPVWIAAYGPACPSLPPGWSDWAFWQYSDGGGALDHDVFNGTIDQLRALGGVAPSGPPTAAPSPPTKCGGIEPGHGLGRGDTAHSCDGRFDLAMQADGNLVLYEGGTALWDTKTAGTDGFAAVMQSDGNFVLYGKTSDPLWNSHTSGQAGATLALQDDGNLVVYGTNGRPLWDSATNVPPAPPPPPKCGGLAPDESLTAGQSVSSCDGRFTLVMQTDGNLVLYMKGGVALWNSETPKTLGYMAIMQGDGNFVLYDRASKPLWYSATSGHGGASLAVQDDGNLVVYAGNGGPALWNSQTAGH